MHKLWSTRTWNTLLYENRISDFHLFTTDQPNLKWRKMWLSPTGYNKQTNCFVQVYYLAPCYKTYFPLHLFTVPSWLSVNFSIPWQDWKKTTLNTNWSLATNDVMLPTPICVLPVLLNAQAWRHLWRQDLTGPGLSKSINSTAPRSSKNH
jgi:hypothetical protein